MVAFLNANMQILYNVLFLVVFVSIIQVLKVQQQHAGYHLVNNVLHMGSKIMLFCLRNRFSIKGNGIHVYKFHEPITSKSQESSKQLINDE